MFPISSAFPVKGFQPVTWTIIGLCVLVAIVQLAIASSTPPETLYMRYGAHPVLVMFDFLPWNADSPTIALTAFTSLFVHAGILHVLFNMLFFHCFSEPIESLMGSLRYAIFYLLCGLAGVIAHSAVNPTSFTPLVGASGAVTGVLLAHTLLLPWTRIRVSLTSESTVPAWGFTALWIGLQIFESLDGTSDTAFGAHAGGGLAGLMLAPLFVRQGVEVLARPAEDAEHSFEYDEGFLVPRWAAAAIAALLVAGLVAIVSGRPKDADPLMVADAREWIAIARLDGVGVPLDTQSGLATYRLAAEAEPKIATRLGDTLSKGESVPKDEREAAEWYRRAAQAKEPNAVAKYALVLVDGKVVPRDRERGLALLLELANDGYAAADLLLAKTLESGRGDAAPDLAGAIARYKHGCETTVPERSKAADRRDACRHYARMLKDGRGVPADPDGAQKVLRQLDAERLLDAGFEALQKR